MMVAILRALETIRALRDECNISSTEAWEAYFLAADLYGSD